jgi:hypothetical protein
MLSQLDNIIFPDRCDILEIVPSQRYVYPIYKNGSSSLYNSGFRLVEHNELPNIPVVDIYVRNPYDRFVTGVNSFLQHNTNLDRRTLLYFVTNYLFLNRHFCPQFYWLVNLQRFTNAKIRINPIESLTDITSLKFNQRKNLLLDEYFSTSEKLHFYLSIDKVLTEDLVGKTVPFKLIVETIKYRYLSVYNEVVQRSIDICNVLD